MSADPLTWQNLDARGLTFAIVVARFNDAITSKLLEGAREALQKAGATGHQVFHVPGAFELPLAAMKLARRGGVEICEPGRKIFPYFFRALKSNRSDRVAGNRRKSIPYFAARKAGSGLVSCIPYTST